MAANYISGDEAVDYQRWTPADLEAQKVRLPTAQDIERVHQEAHREGYETGQNAGYQAGLAKAQTEAARLSALMHALDASIQNLEQNLGQDVLSLSLDIAKQILRQAFKVKPELLLPIVRSVMESLPQNAQHPHIHLHPEDAALVRELLSAELPHAGWKVVDDPRVARGGCLIETATSEVDATLPNRWQRLAAALGQDNSWLDDV